MIVDDLLETLYRKRSTAMQDKHRENLKMVIYIERSVWYEMMDELKGGLTAERFDLYQNRGKSILQCPIHQVLTTGHGIKVYEL
jgi:hypothetical protein